MGQHDVTVTTAYRSVAAHACVHECVATHACGSRCAVAAAIAAAAFTGEHVLKSRPFRLRSRREPLLKGKPETLLLQAVSL